MRILIILILLFTLTCCKDNADIEKEIKTISVSKEFEINKTNDVPIYKIGDLAITDSSDLFITDIIDQKLKAFDKSGIFQNSTGGIENNTDGFKKVPFLLSYDNNAKRLAVYEFSNETIQYFNNNLKQINQLKLKLKAPIIGFQFDNELNLITVYPLAVGGNKFVNIWDNNGENITSFNLTNIGEYSMMDMFKFKFNKYSNKIIITFLFKNLIQVYSKDGNLEKEFSLPFFPEKSETKTEITKASYGTIQREVPIYKIFEDITCDSKGRILLLAGHYSNGGEGKRIYIVNKDGTILNKIELDTKVRNIFADDYNCLFAVSEKGNAIIKYRINEK